MVFYFFRALLGFLMQTVPPAFLCIYPFWARQPWDRKRPVLFFVFGGFLILGCFIAMVFVDTIRTGQPVSNVNLINLLMFLEQGCCFLIYLLVIRAPFFKKLYCLIFISSFYAGIALVASFLNRLLFPGLSMGLFVQDGYLWPLPGLSLYAVLVAVSYPFLFSLMRRMSRHLLTPARPGFWPSLCVPPALFYLWIFLTPNDLLYGWIITSATALMLVLLLCVAFFSLQNLTWVAELEAQTPVPDTRELLSREAYTALRHKLQSSEILVHDFRHHLLILKKLFDDGDLGPADRLLQSLLNETEAVKPVLLSGNYLIDTIVNGRLSGLPEAGVPVHAQAQVPEILPVDYELVYQALNAVLSAAVDACAAAPPGMAVVRLSLDYSDECMKADCAFPDTQPREPLAQSLTGLKGCTVCDTAEPDSGMARITFILK
ncbi:hypothetical protein [Eubacterium sp. 1001713B170207_170306_E7]|uniref:hypothetical protein n=1 Tax=Eubacterium sp. 1001713B170207_170306_E7 TaxID=2787097 RepID=UPI00189BD10C|nr:hypothetical protein [Eubacterium sp. 1001713B170207_170306_E7]